MNVSFRKFPAVMAAALVPVAAAALVLVPARPAAAQEEVQDEGAAYRAWHAANQANQTAQAIEAATAYLKQYPTGQYADFIKKWLGQARMAVLDATIKEKRTADMVKMGRQILAGDPENLNILYALAFNIRRNELLASPASYENSAAAVEFSSKAIALIEAGKTLAGVQSFDKNATLAWLTQILAMNEAKGGKAAEAIRLYEKSTSLAPQDPGIASRNLYAVYALRLSFYGEAVKAYNALPEADKTAGEPKPEVKAARDKVNAEADTLIDSAAAFVAFAKVKNLPPAARDKVNQTLEAVYKSRHPEDAGLAGLQKVLQEKEQVLGAAPAPGA
jgi:hypothetical protein